jgi:hypothetical protein
MRQMPGVQNRINCERRVHKNLPDVFWPHYSVALLSEAAGEIESWESVKQNGICRKGVASSIMIENYL